MFAAKDDAIFTVFAPLKTGFGANDHMRALRLSLLFCVNPPIHLSYPILCRKLSLLRSS